MGGVDIDPLTGAPIVKPLDAGVTSDAKDFTKDTTAHDLSTTSTPSTDEVKTDVELENTVEALEKKVADKQVALIEANDTAVKAHGELMDAQRALSVAKAH